MIGSVGATMAQTGENQLGDFIRGRFLFVEETCRASGRDPERTLETIKQECFRLAETPERREFLERKLFGGAVLASAVLPDWLDKVFLEAISHVLRGPGAPLFTTSSRTPCVASEAGRFNARRQAASVFAPLYARKRPVEWLRTTFPIIYRQCYGATAAAGLKIEDLSAGRFRVTLDNRGLEKAGPLDCSTALGYLCGALEVLGAKDPVVTHAACGLLARPPAVCLFEVTWREA